MPSHHDGARIRVTMRLHAFVMAFMGLWLSGATFGGLVGGAAALSSGKVAGLAMFAFPLFGLGICIVPFAIEAGIAERRLREAFASAPGYSAPVPSGYPNR
jgi:hypothetical protein